MDISTRDSLFYNALQKWEGYLRNISRKMCRRRGLSCRSDEDDFFQIATIALLDAVTSFNGTPDDPGFFHHLNTVMRNDFLDEIGFHSAGMRDFRKDVHESTITTASSNEAADFLSSFFGTCSDPSTFDPLARLELKELVRRSRHILGTESVDPNTGDPIPGTGTDEFYLFNEFVYTEMFGPHPDLSELYQQYLDEKCWFLVCPICGYMRVVEPGYEDMKETCDNPYEDCDATLKLCAGRKHEKIPLVVYARGFGWKRSHARRILSNIRQTLIDTCELNPEVFTSTA